MPSGERKEELDYGTVFNTLASEIFCSEDWFRGRCRGIKRCPLFDPARCCSADGVRANNGPTYLTVPRGVANEI